MSATEIFAHILIFWFDVDGLVHCFGVLMLTQPQIKIMSVGISMLHQYNTICTYFQIDVTPLYVACWKGHLDIVECLLRANADVNLQRNVRQNYLPYFWGFLTHELIFHLITPINLMCDWWPVCSNGRHQILTLQISVASHDCEMKYAQYLNPPNWFICMFVLTWAIPFLPPRMVKLHSMWHAPRVMQKSWITCSQQRQT